jgi:DNA-binding NarL/FixJ family response regulator
MSVIRILLADDHAVVRRGLALVLRQEPDFAIVGEAQDGEAAYNMVFDRVPDVVLLDWKMPRMDGLTAARLIKRDLATAKTLILSGAPVEEDVLDALDFIDGFVHKDTTPTNLAHAIRTVASGQRYLGPDVTQALIQRSRRPAPPAATVALSPRELEVLNLMATPATYSDIADQLAIGETTVRTYVKRIMHKLAQPNRTQAVIAALRHGLIDLD